VLDAGVGAGRYTDVVSRWEADVVGVDLSYAVEAANKNFKDRPNVWIAQADIGALPFKPQSFDAIFSIGVLHHTPNTEAYFKKLVPLLKPGGTIAIWVYPKEGDYLIRNEWIRFVNKIPPPMFYAWCRWFVPWAQEGLDRPLVGMVRRLFPFSTQGLGLENDILDTFDGYSPRFHGIHSPEEVEGWFRGMGLTDIRRPSDWNTCVRGSRPTNGP
jgi:SAM-dependent methyltransferase